ncbi:flippase [Limibaculum sp. FT325]|uniref:flippase n=1 Tax=Thermohalobaculum sediminis TaxID=2939436 RepID=UPI0020C061F7|nr:flippase [Limibaculum sediminis]MCL5778965.1 flippase [Limibaculum sediminis]
MERAPDEATDTTASRPVLAAGALWSFLGQGVPLLVALVTIPVLVAEYGTERFGVLALVWAAVGYFTLFDLGLSRALTQWVAGRTDRAEGSSLGSTIWTALLLMGLLGLLGGVALAAATPWLVETVLTMPQELVGEARTSFLLVAASVPFLTFSQALRGILEAHLKFAIVNAVRIPLGSLTMLGPLFLLLFSDSLVPAVVVVVLSRVADGALYLWFCLGVQPELRERIRIQIPAVVPLMRFGGWMTVSNIVGPMMLFLDRFLIGSLVSVAATAFYATPYDIVTRLLIVPAAISAVLFPAFAAAAKSSDPRRTLRLFVSGLKYAFAALFPFVFLIVVFATELLDVWIGEEFARESATVLRILAIGVLVNCLAQIAFALIQGLGRADITAKFHLAEAPFYLVLLWWSVSRFGIEGAAAAWTIRVTADAVLLAIAAARVADCPAAPLVRAAAILAFGTTLAVLVASVDSGSIRIVLSGAVVGLCVVLTWMFALSVEDRRFLSFRQALR